MDIIIAGAGAVGFRLAEVLSVKHNVVLIDKRQAVLSKLDESADILSICGDIKSPETYRNLENKSFDFFIAITDSDDANLISLLISSEFIDVKSKIVRFKSNFFHESSLVENLNIQHPIFPFRTTAKTIQALAQFPKANNVKSFYRTNKKLVSIIINEPIDICEIQSDKIKFVGIERGNNFFVPNQEDTAITGDLLYIFGNGEDIREFNASIEIDMPKQVKNIAIFGADSLGIEVADLLSQQNKNIKIIDKNIENCELASELLDDEVEVINSKYNEHDVFKSNGITNADMVIISSDSDEKNITKALETKEYGIKKVITINNDIRLYSLMHKYKISSVQGPKTSAFYSILEKIKSNYIVTNNKYCGGEGISFSRKIYNGSPLISHCVSYLEVENTKTYILREDKIINLNFDAIIEPEDTVIAFGTIENEEEIYEWISNLKPI